MEKGKRKTTTTPRKTPNANSATLQDSVSVSVQHTRLKMGRLKGVRGTTTVNEKRKSDNSDTGLEDAAVLMKVTDQSCNNSESDDGSQSQSRSQRSLYQATSSSRMKMTSSSGYSPVLKKSRSEPMQGGGSRSENELRKVRSDNWDNNNDDKSDKNDAAAEGECWSTDDCDLDHVEQSDINRQEDDSIGSQDLANDDEDDEDEVKEIKDEVMQEMDGCETEVVVAESVNEKVAINTSGDPVNHVVGDEDQGEDNKTVDDEDTCDNGRDGGGGGSGGGDESTQLNDSKENKIVGGDIMDAKTSNDNGGGGGGGADGGGGNGDGLIPLNLSKRNESKTKKAISAHINKFNSGSLPKSTTPTSTPSTSPAIAKPATSTSVSNSTPTLTPTSTSASYKPITSRSNRKLNLKSPTKEREASKENDNSATSETHGKLQALVDLVMWRDVSRSAFIFGIGTFLVISSSYAKDFEFSLISVAAYISLFYLAIVFLYKSFMYRGIVDKEDNPEMYVWGEEEALWLVKLILPYMNELLLKLRGIFSGDPAMTMKLAVVLFVLARCGSSITLWKTIKLGFFGVFTLPKLCSSYSTHISAYGNFWVRRFRDAWESCSHKKAVAFTIFTLVWNYSSVIARTWAVFMLIVAFRYYQQFMMTQDFVEEQQPVPHNVHIRNIARNRSRITSLDQTKQKKSF